MGGLLGQLLISAAGKTGAKIIILLLLFVSVMILTGTTLIGLFRTIKKPVEVVNEGIQTARQRREEERVILQEDWEARSAIDVPLEPSIPMGPSSPNALFPPVEPRKKQKRSEKLDKLEKVFGIEAPRPELQPEPEPEEKPEDELPASPVFSPNPPAPVSEPEPETEAREEQPKQEKNAPEAEKEPEQDIPMPKPRMQEPEPRQATPQENAL